MSDHKLIRPVESTYETPWDYARALEQYAMVLEQMLDVHNLWSYTPTQWRK
jgi:hypothetical protein